MKHRPCRGLQGYQRFYEHLTDDVDTSKITVMVAGGEAILTGTINTRLLPKNVHGSLCRQIGNDTR